MATRVLLGIIAALQAVLIPGQAAVRCSEPLTWPRLSLPRLRRGVAGDLGEVAAEAPAV
jgi:hypothetical protein